MGLLDNVHRRVCPYLHRHLNKSEEVRTYCLVRHNSEVNVVELHGKRALLFVFYFLAFETIRHPKKLTPNPKDAEIKEKGFVFTNPV